MDILFHCSKNALKCVKKSSHRVGETCETLKIVISNKPDYGALLRRHTGLRKMRVKVPSLNVGKSGGYRCIYRYEIVDEVLMVIFLSTYFKGDKENLTESEYNALQDDSEHILSNITDYEWENA